MAISVNIVSPSLGFGYQADIEVTANLLRENGFDVTCTGILDLRRRGRYVAFARTMLRRGRRFDINLFHHHVFPEWLPLARKNICVPNVEDVATESQDLLGKIDLFLAKTRLTERVFREKGYNVTLINFTSRDLYDPEVPRDYTRFFHACSSEFKGTRALVDVWAKHPEWPELVATINHSSNIPDDLPSNIRTIRKALPLEEVRRIRNSFGFHLCPSEAEGFGHYIVEAMSCRAVVYTTDGAPMNEIVQPGRGFLLEPMADTTPRGFAKLYTVKPESIEQAVASALKLDRATIDQIGMNAREHYLSLRKDFTEKFPEAVRSVLD